MRGEEGRRWQRNGVVCKVHMTRVEWTGLVNALNGMHYKCWSITKSEIKVVSK